MTNLDWLTTAEAAAVLGISEQSVRDRVLGQLSEALGEKRRKGPHQKGGWLVFAPALGKVVLRPQGRPLKSAE